MPIDKFDAARTTFGKEKVDNFLAAFGLGPKYVPKEPKKYKSNVYYEVDISFSLNQTPEEKRSSDCKTIIEE